MENHEHHGSTDNKDQEPWTVCKLWFVSKKTTTAFIASAATVLLAISGGIILQCNIDARENGEQNVKIDKLEKAHIELLQTVNKVADATSSKQQEILNAIDDIKRMRER
jgi:hypothetical protein